MAEGFDAITRAVSRTLTDAGHPELAQDVVASIRKTAGGQRVYIPT